MKSERNLAALTDQGETIFQRYLDDLAEDPTLEPPVQILDNALSCYNLNITKFTNAPSPRVVKLRAFKDKFDFAEYITPLIGDLAGIERIRGFWSWLTLFYFDEICPSVDGRRKKLRNAFYIHDLNYLNSLKHHLAGSYFIYKKHGELAKPLLLDKMPVLSYFREAMVSRMNFVNCKSLVEVMNTLYFDKENGKLKDGVTKRIKGRNGKDTPDAGTHRRLLQFEKRLARNYDFYSMSSEEILKILPNEFDLFQD